MPRAMTKIFAERSAEKRQAGEALIREADNLACQSWNERMWSDGGPIDPSPVYVQRQETGQPVPLDFGDIRAGVGPARLDGELRHLRDVATRRM